MRKFCSIIFLTVLLSYGCASHQIAGVSETMILKEPPQIAIPVTETPVAVPEEIPASAKERLFSLSVRDANVRDLLLLLSKDSGINIIADRDVTGNLSIDFSDLDLNSALYAITRQLGYTFRMDKGFIRVTSPVLETRSFKIDYITGKRASSSSINASMSTSSGSSSGTSSGSTTVSSSTSGTGSSSSGQGNVNITTSGTSDFWKEMKAGLEMIIFDGDAKSGKDGKKLVINELAGVVHITDYSDNMERIEDFLNDVEMSVSKQVMIQAHIVEVSLDDGYKFGIDWNLLTGTGNGAITTDSGTEVTGELFSFSQLIAPDTNVFSIKLSNKKITALLNAMQEQGQVNVLSSPKVSTMNNQRAVMKLTTNEVSWITTTTYNADGKILTQYTNPQIDEVGLFLDVTPQINDSGIITMQVHPSISEKIGESISPLEDNSKPVINTRELDTMVSVSNGQTIVIAGLITDKIIENIRKVPFLGDLPLFGKLFQQVIHDKKKSELVIFLTPYILNNKSIEEIRKEHEERLKRAGRDFEAIPELRRVNSEI
ncbi:MAG: secretin N-terminal domain-containing protein [Thermodesulfovibrionia bacterium]|nr:secretin N-terminal domain-containing protein [Thermodesulfovibrionia bacterium]